jgi:hypothetical protein
MPGWLAVRVSVDWHAIGSQYQMPDTEAANLKSPTQHT